MNSQIYRGFHEYKMDSKYRVSVKSSWRPEAGKCFYLLLTTRLDLPMVKVFNEETYNKKVALIESDPEMTPAEKDELLGQLAQFCSEVTVNDQGKMAVPQSVCEKAGIQADSEVTLTGRGAHFEIWSRENFAKVFEIDSKPKKDSFGIF